MRTEPYLGLAATWPAAGRHILASYTDTSVVVYQAFRPAIARYAVEHQRFGGEFSYGRMSWIKPNFLWMMFRCGWARKEHQEHVLAVEVRRAFFDELLEHAVPSGYDTDAYPTREAWQQAVADSGVRLQWDPDHDPHGAPLARRAVQLGLRGTWLRRYGETEVLSITDVTPFVAQQRARLDDPVALQVPAERVYKTTAAAARRIRLDSTA